MNIARKAAVLEKLAGAKTFPVSRFLTSRKTVAGVGAAYGGTLGGAVGGPPGAAIGAGIGGLYGLGAASIARKAQGRALLGRARKLESTGAMSGLTKEEAQLSLRFQGASKGSLPFMGGKMHLSGKGMKAAKGTALVATGAAGIGLGRLSKAEK
jgi:hypothetical protein